MKTSLHIRIEEHSNGMLQKMADEQRRSLSDMVRIILEDEALAYFEVHDKREKV